MDVYDRYLEGIGDLLQAVELTDSDYLTTLTLQGRLAQAISETRQYGPTDNARVEIARVITEVDRICLAHLGQSFRSLCNVGELPEAMPPRVYHNLPHPDYGPFVGREKELARIHELLSPASRHFLVTIDGIGGIGKSTLALEVAHHYLTHATTLPETERFYAIIWISAKHATLSVDKGITLRKGSTLNLEDVCTKIGIALSDETITRAIAPKQVEIVRCALTRQRVLLILDNLETLADDQAVMEFLRDLPVPTKAIITTRRRTDVGVPIHLTRLPENEAKDLILQEIARKEVSIDDNDMEKLYVHTNGVPLAIVFSVGRIAFGYPVDSVLGSLPEPNQDFARFCFEESLKAIQGTHAYTLLEALAVFAVDATQDALCLITQFDDESFDEARAALERLSLLNQNKGRFSLLPLTKSYMSRKMTGRSYPLLPGCFRLFSAAWALPKTAGRSYLVLQRTWYRLFLEKYGGYRKAGPGGGFDRITSEIDNIIGAMAEMDRALRSDVDDLVYFARRLSDYLYFHDRWGDRIEWCEKAYHALTRPQALGDRRRYDAAWLARDVGWTYYQAEAWQEAEEWTNRSWSMIQDAADLEQVERKDTGKDDDGEMEFSWLYTVVQGLRAHVAMQHGDYSAAENLFRQSLAVQRRLYDAAKTEEERQEKASQVAIYYSDLGKLWKKWGDLKVARQYYSKVLERPWSVNEGRIAEAKLSLAEIALREQGESRVDLEEVEVLAHEALISFESNPTIAQNYIRDESIRRCQGVFQELKDRGETNAPGRPSHA